MLTSQTTQQRCPCGSEKSFAFCCEPYIEGQKPAPTAEQLMRSRYTAFALGAIDYLIDTTVPEKRELIDRAIVAEQIQFTTWTGLTILNKEAGSKEDTQGVVEFEAAFETEDDQCILHERSSFYAKNGQWYYADGEVNVRSVA
ncbi:YchJ family protein [Neptunomonas qingdaonensis]|uniref:SEC-C motif-containing protein n=1 Tax=Neptunomonas qingdaonensis TaxID=1045558 RepID=A0A1I2THM9_9GAMM|nr:YchJ family protein [Neptunomonas qingdaonensis]SFG64400.1 SEC-C motif-containing protein [Neptunomonas qingdaonensis]